MTAVYNVRIVPLIMDSGNTSGICWRNQKELNEVTILHLLAYPVANRIEWEHDNYTVRIYDQTVYMNLVINAMCNTSKF